MVKKAGGQNSLLACPPVPSPGQDHIEHSQQDDVEANEQTNSVNNTTPVSKHLICQLYVSHFLSTWNSRLFEFAAILFLAAIYPGTLLEISIYAAARGIIAVLLAQTIGDWIDRGERITVVRTSIIGQRLAVVASCLLFWPLNKNGVISSTYLKSGMFAIVIVLACVEKVCSVINLVSVERDWVVVITEGNAPFRQILNARMRRIDLLCKLLGPLTISLIALPSTAIAIWATLAMSVVSVAIECFAIENVYRKIPALGERPNQEAEPSETPRHQSTILFQFKKTAMAVFPASSMSYYFQHPAFIPSFSLSLLYLTVLSFSGQMITYLISVGYNSLYVGLVRAISTVFELSATWVAPRLAKRIGIIRGGIWSLSWQMAWLAGGITWFFAGLDKYGSDSFIPATGLVAGVALSRVGLWGYDLCAQNIIQDEVDLGHRGSFSTSEQAFQNLFEVLSYATTMIFRRPDQFKWPALISIVAVYIAGGLYGAFVRKRRHHFFHRPPCLPQRKIRHSTTQELSVMNQGAQGI